MKRLDFNPNLLLRPERFEPDWFKISSSMSDAYSSCRELFVWQYIHHIRERKTDHKLLRRSCVIFAIREDLIRKFPEPSISERVLYFLKSEAKNIIKMIDRTWADWEDECKTLETNPVEQALYMNYDFPSPDDKRWYFTFDEFILQCIVASRKIRSFLEENKLQPLIYDGFMFVQKTLDAPLIINGEILDETHSKPTIMRAQINYVDTDQNIYIWRISSKRSSSKDMVAITSEVVDNQCAVVSYHLGNDCNFPMSVDLRKIVVNKFGEITEFESHKRNVSMKEVSEAKLRMAIKAKDIKNMNLFKERSWKCPMCNYYDVCIRGETDGFVREVWSDADDITVTTIPEKKDEEEIDDLPW